MSDKWAVQVPRMGLWAARTSDPDLPGCVREVVRGRDATNPDASVFRNEVDLGWVRVLVSVCGEFVAWNVTDAGVGP